ncbi:MmcQ/YjbR family DNA-binding protein [uncultured Phenylobacterium sp.]|uniref:MmcQ/YjbR family DNA-binding protein n=1 Tax=uncultured Phenylobacterium sp. TaxID=349273 RepID=UPI0025DAAF6A|nr:MmcQ/YjbR family DNA-binding protein [uncultured Phenylobacterium sp.]
MTTRAEVQTLALALPEATQVTLWNRVDVYKVRLKVFGVCSERDGLSFKATQIAFAVLTDDGPGRPAPGFPKGAGTWVNLPLSEVSREEAADWLATSYRLVAGALTRKARAELGIEP